MAIPDFQSVLRPLLAYASDGDEKSLGDAVIALVEHFNLTDEEKNRFLPSGKQTLIRNRIAWALTYLVKAKALIRTRRAHFRITERGNLLLKKFPDRIKVSILKQFPEFRAFHGFPDNDALETGAPSAPESVAPSLTPDESLDAIVNEINSRLESELLDRIAESSPEFFERLVVDLIEKMGYGGRNPENVIQRQGKSGDEGIDGIINQDALGLDVVHIQAKRYDKDATIGREKIQSFAGALVGKNATKGIFVATCSFSKGAVEYAQKVPQKIILIDAKKLVNLLIKYEVGVSVKRPVLIMRIDLDYFDEDEL